MRSLILATILLAACPEGRAGWGPGGCGPVGLPVVVLQAPPKPEPKAETREQPKENFGIDIDKYRAETQAASYSIRGRACSRSDFVEALTQGTLADDTHKLRLTVIGGEPERKQVVSDLAASPDLAPFRETVLVQAYAPEHWAVREAGFVTSGTPTIYVQRPDGKVLHRQDNYSGGAAQLAEAIRRIRPDYDPKRDPDALRNPKAPAGGEWWETAKWIALFVGVGFLLLVFGLPLGLLLAWYCYRLAKRASATAINSVRSAAAMIAHPPDSKGGA